MFVNEWTVGSLGVGSCPGASFAGPNTHSPNRAGCLRFSPESSFCLLQGLKFHTCSAEREGDLMIGFVQTARGQLLCFQCGSNGEVGLNWALL